MKTTNETCSESNYSSFIKESFQKNSLGYFPLLKFKENLYNTCQSKFSEYINNKKDYLKLIVNNKINQQISINDYIHNSFNDMNTKLTPIPSINKRGIKNEGEKKELQNFQRNVVLMRRLEYTKKMREKDLKKKYKNQNNQIILIQKMIRGYLVRKVINQVNIINETLINFIFLISFCIRKKYFYFWKNKMLKGEDRVQIERNVQKENDLTENTNPDFNIDNTIQNEFNNNIENENKLTKSAQFVEEEGKIIKNNNINQLELINEKINKINENTNIINNNEVKNEENFNNNKINNKSDDNILINYNDKKQNKTNTDDINNNENANTKVKKSIAKLTEELRDIKIENKESNILSNQNAVKCNSPNNIDSVIENDDYINFSGKGSKKMIKNTSKKNNINYNNAKDNPKKNALNYNLSEISNTNVRKTKTETLQRQFRKYLYRKGYYGNFDKRKIAIIYLLKNMVLYNIKLYLFNILKSIYKDILNISITQEDIFVNISSERIENVKQNYKNASSHIIFN